MTPPPFAATTSAFSLAEGANRLVFEGQAIIWGKDPAPEQIWNIAERSGDGRKIHAQMLAYERDVLLPAQNAVAAAAAELKTVAATGTTAGRGAARASHAAPVAGWFKQRLNGLVAAGGLQAATADDAQAMFKGYCEAKLWEFASSVLARTSYAARPTPAQICEDYYVNERKYFSDPALCAPAPAGQSYFQCIWKTGVISSPLLAAVDSAALKCRGEGTAVPDGLTAYDNRAAAVRAWVESGKLEQMLSRTEGAAMATAIMNGLRPGRRVLPTIPEWAECEYAFKREPPPTTDTTNWQTSSPDRLLQVVESTSESPDARLLPGTYPAADVAAVEEVRTVARAFAQRVGTGAVALSQSDAVFLEPTALTLDSDPYSDAPAKLAVDPVFKALLDAVASGDVRQPAPGFAEAQTRLAAAESALAAAKTKVIADDSAYPPNAANPDAPKDPEGWNQAQRIAAVLSPGATQFLGKFVLALTRSGGKVQVDVKFDDSVVPVTEVVDGAPVVVRYDTYAYRKMVGCLDVATGAACAEAGPLPDNAVPLTRVAYNPAEDRLVLQLQMDDPDAIGMRHIDRFGAMFNDLYADDLRGRVLEFEFYGNRLDDAVDIFTGNFFVWQNGTKVYKGSLTGDNYQQRVQELRQR